jgi:heme iron utilization protein
MPQPDPHLPADDTARAMAQSLLAQARHAALAVTDPTTNTPNISRIALLHTGHQTLTLISTLSAHTAALTSHPPCAFMVGDPGPKGDPLTHPRLMVQATATILPRDHPDHARHRTAWLHSHPKAKLYIDFADFRFVTLAPTAALLNAGFGRAYRLLPADLAQ